MMSMLRVIGDTTFDIGPGDVIRMAACLCPGMLVGVNVDCGASVRVARVMGVNVLVGIDAIAV